VRWRRGYPVSPNSWHDDAIAALRGQALSPDGRHLAVGGGDKVLMWELDRPDAEPLALHCPTKGAVGAVAFSPDSRRLAGGTIREVVPAEAVVRVWDLDRPLAEPLVFPASGLFTAAVCFSPDGHRLAAAHGAGILRVWNLDRPGDLPLTLSW